MGRIIAIDYGQKRVGLAVTDPLRITANALETVPTHQVLEYLKTYIDREQVDLILVGKPLQMNGEASEATKIITPFVTQLSKLFPGIPLIMADERFTSVLAQRTMLEAGLKKKDRQNKSTVDKIAATIILLTYLESNR